LNSPSFMAGTQAGLRFLFLLAASFFIGVGCLKAQSAALAPGTAKYRSAVEQETFSLINQYRKKSGLPVLTWDDEIAKAARGHSMDMAAGDVDFGHDGFHERVSHLKEALSGVRGAGENVFMTDSLDGVAQFAVTQWLRSSHHLENIRGDYNYSGLGVWQAKGGTIYFTQIFVKITKVPEETAQANPAPAIMTPFGDLGVASTRARP
jgi:uncharacterized protein YkwD